MTLLFLLDQSLHYPIASSTAAATAFGAESLVGETPIEFGAAAKSAASVVEGLAAGAVSPAVVPVEFGGAAVQVALDVGVIAELGIEVRLSPTLFFETLASVLRSVAGSFDSGAAVARESNLPSDRSTSSRGGVASSIEASNATRRDSVVSIEFSGTTSSVARNHPVPLTIGRDARRDQILSSTWGAALTRSAVFPIEWTQITTARARDTTVPLEFTRAIFIEEVPLEASSVVLRSIVVPVEWAAAATATVARNTLVPVDVSSARQANSTIRSDLAGQLSRSSLASLDALRSARLNGSVLVTLARITLSSSWVPSDRAGLIAVGALLGEESAAGIQRSSLGPSELSVIILRSRALLSDRGAAVQPAKTTPIEWGTLATITNIAVNRAVALEWSASRLRDHRLGVEVLVSRSAGVPVLIETGGLIRGASVIPEEAPIVAALNRQEVVDLGAGRLRQLISLMTSGADVSRSAAVPAEFISTIVSVARSFSAALEWQARRVSDGMASAEVLARSLRSLGVPIELRSVTTSVGTSYFLLLEIAPHLTVIGYAFGADAPLWVVMGSDEAVDTPSSDDAATGQVTSTDI